MESLNIVNNAPILLDDLGFFLVQGIYCLFGKNQQDSEKCFKIFLEIISCLEDNKIHELTMKYCSMRLDENDIELVGLSFAKELMELGLNFAKTIDDKVNMLKLHMIIIIAIKCKIEN